MQSLYHRFGLSQIQQAATLNRFPTNHLLGESQAHVSQRTRTREETPVAQETNP